MDKFGIFNLLNSFLDFYKSNSTQNTIKTTQESPTPNTKSPSLSSQLLSISKTHDEHVKRVKKSAQTQSVSAENNR